MTIEQEEPEPYGKNRRRKKTQKVRKERKHKIEWTNKTWNPFVGCTKISPGCKNCYAKTLTGRGLHAHHTEASKWLGQIVSAPNNIWLKPYSWRKAELIFVNSLSDVFHDNVPPEWLQRLLCIIEDTPQHRYQILTKRPENIMLHLARIGRIELPENVWIGTSVEESAYKSRIDELRKVPAQLRFLSVEPVTGHVGELNLEGIHWVITGGESGHNARQVPLGWFREIRDSVLAQDVRFFFKQWGKPEFNPLAAYFETDGDPAENLKDFICRMEGHESTDDMPKGGCSLDGRFWLEMP